MTHTTYAFIKANWHADIVDRALEGFCSVIPADQVDVFDVPGAFEMPLLAYELAATKRYSAIAAAAERSLEITTCSALSSAIDAKRT